MKTYHAIQVHQLFPPTILSLPPELQLTVYKALDNLDNALFFSMTCKVFRDLYLANSILIQRDIVV